MWKLTFIVGVYTENFTYAESRHLVDFRLIKRK